MYSTSRRSASGPAVLLGALLLLVLVVALQLLRGAPDLQAQVSLPNSLTLGEPRTLAMPAAGSTAVSVEGLGQIGLNGPTTPRPIASITKMMTAYLILKDKPLKPGETGPTVTITARDAARYQEMILEDQSVLPVIAGQQLSQYDMLVGMLVPSGNNFAEILAAWDAGSVPAFVSRMNAEAQALGMTSTTYADVSGYSPSSVSTPADQVLLARAALQNPVFAQIVGMQQARLPGIGLVTNVNQLLGQEGVFGIKTGLTPESGGSLAFAAKRAAGDQSYEVIGVVLGQATRPAAFEAARQILRDVSAGLQYAHVVAAGQPVASIDPPWTGVVDVVIGEDVRALVWPGMNVETTVEIDQLKHGMDAGERVGWLYLRLGAEERRVPLTLASDLPGPSLGWKLTRT